MSMVQPVRRIWILATSPSSSSTSSYKSTNTLWSIPTFPPLPSDRASPICVSETQSAKGDQIPGITVSRHPSKAQSPLILSISSNLPHNQTVNHQSRRRPITTLLDTTTAAGGSAQINAKTLLKSLSMRHSPLRFGVCVCKQKAQLCYIKSPPEKRAYSKHAR